MAIFDRNMNICVRNISCTATERDLRDAFAAFGEVQSASIIKDKFSDESRGFGFVKIPNKEGRNRQDMFTDFTAPERKW